MENSKFQEAAEIALEKLPEKFKGMITNAIIVIEDYPDDDTVKLMRLRSRYQLLGLYQGVPMTHRNTSYGMYPVTPDKITLYQKNIEKVCNTDTEVEEKVIEVLVHEIGHHFGMNEEEVRAAGF